MAKWTEKDEKAFRVANEGVAKYKRIDAEVDEAPTVQGAIDKVKERNELGRRDEYER